MNISNATNNRIISGKIVVDQPTIFLTLPDSNLKIWDHIYKTNLILSNCEGIISINKIVKFVNNRFNGKIHTLDFKKKIIEMDQTSKKLKILNNIHVNKTDDKNTTPSNKYYFYDMSVYSNAINEIIDKINPRKITEELLISSGKIYQTIKKNYPVYNVDMILLMKDDQGFLWQMLDNLKTWVPVEQLNENTFFDSFCFVSTDNRYMIPVMNREDGKNKYILKNINNLPGYFVADNTDTKEIIVEPEPEPEKEPEKEPANNLIQKITPNVASNVVSSNTAEIEKNKEPINQDIPKEIVKGLTKELKVNTNIDEDGEIKVEINTNQLKKILNSYDIKDQNVLANVKVAIDRYLTNNHETKEKMTRDQAELLVLKAINKTIHGTEEIRDAYKNDPKLLFDKLKNTQNYKVNLKFPAYENELIQPKDIVDLDYTCGQYRQKFEFDEAVHHNVEKLFHTLEEFPNYPVKVKNIEHEIIDTDSDRLIQYKVTLQNLNGGHSKPYEIKLNIPGLVSERYFKLKNSHYVMQSQQFMKPITKTDPNEVRLLSNYAIIRVSLTNFRFNSADISEYINYIKIKYPKFIKEETEDYIILFNGDKLGLTGNLVYSNADESKKIEIDPDSNKLVDLAQRSRLNITKYEYQLEYLFNKLKEVNNNETLSKSKLKIPYLEIYLGGLRLPLILYLWSQKGLLISLNDESIEYTITDKEPDKKSSFSIITNKTQYLNIFPKDFRQTCFVNGLLKLQAVLKDKNIDDLNNPESSYEIISSFTASSGAIRMISLMTENEIDPITKDLLEFEGNSTNIVKLVSKDMIDVLFKKKPDNLADLSIYRARLSEMIFYLLYKQIKMAHNNYRNKVFGMEDQEAKVELFEDFVTQGLVTQSGVLQNAEPFNPIDEVALASRVVKSGKGGCQKRYATIHSNMY